MEPINNKAPSNSINTNIQMNSNFKNTFKSTHSSNTYSNSGEKLIHFLFYRKSNSNQIDKNILYRKSSTNLENNQDILILHAETKKIRKGLSSYINSNGTNMLCYIFRFLNIREVLRTKFINKKFYDEINSDFIKVYLKTTDTALDGLNNLNDTANDIDKNIVKDAGNNKLYQDNNENQIKNSKDALSKLKEYVWHILLNMQE